MSGSMGPTVPADPTLTRDLRLILAIQAARAFGYGFGTVILGTALAASGFSDTRVALLFTAILAGMALTTLGVGLWGDRIGRRRLYTLLLATMAVVGIVFAFAGSWWALVIAALTGTMSTDANESGPITSLEQAMIGQAPAVARVYVFGRYNAVAYLAGAIGALAAGGPAFFRRFVPAMPADRRFLLVLVVVAAIGVGLARRLSPAMESAGSGDGRALGRSRPAVIRLASLFALDAFAGGFIVTTFVVFWFGRRFDASPETLSLVVFAGGLLQAGSSIVAARFGSRFGLLRTMVGTHLPSNVLLMLIPFMPTLGSAIAVLLLRFTLSQMDVPTRQAYVAALVEPEERTAAAAFTNTARYVARPFGPAVGAVLMSAFGLGAPFVAAGGLKVVYDLLVWRGFRRIPIDER